MVRALRAFVVSVTVSAVCTVGLVMWMNRRADTMAATFLMRNVESMQVSSTSIPCSYT